MTQLEFLFPVPYSQGWRVIFFFRDDVDNFTVTKQIFDELELGTYSEQDCRLVRHVCSLVSKRAAYLASAGIACLLNKMGRKEATVGVDGSLYRFHPFFHDLMMEKISQLIRPNLSCNVIVDFMR
ncbi:phosphotransferase [Elysia marginata]|uniref:Phosphotransferase n=1 Tax=Elysia marginata TaxID=1093978 RepID=A0AAV4FXG9_9GAST|nr:phosphotransferase [Elysia marginata]